VGGTGVRGCWGVGPGGKGCRETGVQGVRGAVDQSCWGATKVEGGFNPDELRASLPQFS